MKWIKTLRPRTTLMAVVLTLVAFKVGKTQIGTAQIVLALYVFIASGLTMAINDWQDRKEDSLGGRTFVAQNLDSFKKFLVGLTVFSVLLLTVLFYQNTTYGAISVVILVVGSMYGAVRRVPLLPGIYVALSSAGPIIYSYISNSTLPLVYLFVGTAAFIYGREILKDLGDTVQDHGTKWTLPLAIGEHNSKYIIVLCYVVSVGAFTFVTPLALYLAPMFLLSSLLTFSTSNIRVLKSLTDIPLLLFMMYVLVLG